jgi:hypothetical protein
MDHTKRMKLHGPAKPRAFERLLRRAALILRGGVTVVTHIDNFFEAASTLGGTYSPSVGSVLFFLFSSTPSKLSIALKHTATSTKDSSSIARSLSSFPSS